MQRLHGELLSWNAMRCHRRQSEWRWSLAAVAAQRPLCFPSFREELYPSNTCETPTTPPRSWLDYIGSGRTSQSQSYANVLRIFRRASRRHSDPPPGGSLAKKKRDLVILILAHFLVECGTHNVDPEESSANVLTNTFRTQNMMQIELPLSVTHCTIGSILRSFTVQIQCWDKVTLVLL